MKIERREAAKGFIFFKNKLLLLRESEAYIRSRNRGKYDVPGGKVEPGEDPLEALKREAVEEAGLVVAVSNPFYTMQWSQTFDNTQYEIQGTFYICHANADQVKLSPAHDMALWMYPKEILPRPDLPLITSVEQALKRYVALFH